MPHPGLRHLNRPVARWLLAGAIFIAAGGAAFFLAWLAAPGPGIFPWNPGAEILLLDPPGYDPGPPELGIEIRSRRDWKARPPIGNTGLLGEPALVTVHHEGSTPFLAEDERATIGAIRSIQRDHQDRQGWVDIAYHLVVDRAGRVWEARPLRWIGAHAGTLGTNRSNIGILVLGNFDEQELPEAQRAALLDLIERIRERWSLDRAAVRTHNEVRASAGEGGTSCPGKNLQRAIEDYRSSASSK